jgi:predicted Zn finger-like uncharacterized protein
MTGGADKRRKKRYAVKNVEIELELTDSNLFSFFKKNKTGRHPLVDFSADGLQFLCTEKIDKDKTLKLTLMFPDMSAPVEVKGQVRWVQQIFGKPLFRTGVALVGETEQIKTILEQIENKLGDAPIRVLCNSCGASFRIKKKLEGKKAKCPKCGQVIQLVESGEMLEDVAAMDVHVSAPSTPAPSPPAPIAMATTPVHTGPPTRLDTPTGFPAVAASSAEPSRKEEPKSGGSSATIPAVPVTMKNLVSDSLFLFLKQQVKTRLHLAVLEYLAKAAAGTNVFPVSDLAAKMGQPEEAIAEVCRSYAAMGMLREVGKRTYNFGPGKSTQDRLAELRRLSMNPKARSAILTFIMEQEKKR